MDDGWKFAEQLLGITAEALKQRAQYKARLEEYQRSPVAGATIALIQSTTRDAALEEAAKEVERQQEVSTPPLHLPNRIRALKSKPATIHLDATGFHGAPVPKGPEIVAQGVELVGGEVRPASHQTLRPCTCYRNVHPHVHVAHDGLTADECSRAGKALAKASGVKHVVVEPGGAVAPPKPAHDFGWALQQMRAGKRVHRPDKTDGLFGPGDTFKPIRFSYNDAIIHDDGTGARLDHGSLRATDWEVVE